MGYESHFTGHITITPPLTWAEIKRGPGLQDVRLELDEKVTENESGQTRIITAVAVLPLTGGAFNGYDIAEELQALVDAHRAHEFTGEIAARPLDPGGEPWRWIIRDRRVVRQVPRLEWVDETPGADQ
jgi:hypothetical protein